ncbi:MAG: glycosyltransferase [Phycisphaerae bacterium]|nr:glycosyltransferase [Phycisphaerae bacterium]
MNNQGITISTVIPVYNNERFVGRAIESVLKQTVPAHEIVVVDDGSTDGTADVVRSFGEKVTLIQQSNAGVSAARNTGIQAAKGNWIAFLDSDDEWLPEKIQLQLELLGRNPDLMWMTGNYEECLCDENRRAPHALPQRCLQFLCGKDYYDSYLHAIQLYQWGHTSCMLIWRQVFDEVGMFNTDISLAEDMDLWLRIGYHYPKVGFLAKPLSIYHLTVSNSLMTAGHSKSLYAAFIERHFDIAESEGVLDEFVPAAGAIMRRWIRGMLFEGGKEEIRQLLRQFPQAFSPLYRGLIYGLTVFPKMTAALLHLLSTMIRRLRMRRRLTRPPVKPAK